MSNSIALSRVETYGVWSEVYDQQPNPMLTLEERVLSALLPSVQGKNVVDLGCGTGRWLARLSVASPASLCGIDISPAMIERASRKLGTGAKLLHADCSQAPLRSDSADLILASFVLSHLPDPKRFSAEVARLLRRGGSVFISDLHPDTARRLNWTRGFRHNNRSVELRAQEWELEWLRLLFERAGLDVVAQIYPTFAENELETVRHSGRTSAAEAAASLPAIYIWQLRHHQPYASQAPVGRNCRVSSVIGGQVALTGSDAATCDLTLQHTCISGMTVGTNSADVNSIDLTGYTVLPGLINAHDHLEFSLFPRLGRRCYRNCKEWYREIHSLDSASIAKYKAIPKWTRIWFGALRNLLCGVTTVCHHNPLTGDMLAEDFPIRVVGDFGWAHSITLEEKFAERHHRTGPSAPFIIHLSEGVDSEAQRDLRMLFDAGALDDRTVIVHGLAISHDEVSIVNRYGAALIWCPSSNVFLFGQTHSSDEIAAFRTVALGSDSPLTSVGDFLDEVRFAADEVGVPAGVLYMQSTSDSARVLRLPDGFGQIRIGAVGDLVAVPASGVRPDERLSRLSYRDIHLVLRGGRIQLASDEIISRIPEHLSQGLRPLQIENNLRWVRAPLGRLFGSAVSSLGCELMMSGRRIGNVVADYI